MSEAPAKAWWQSKTILGIIGLVAVLIAERANLPVTQDEAGELITLAVALVSAAVAIFGRVRARKEIKITVPGGTFNPHAEVRKPKRYKFPKTGGYAVEPGMFLLLLACTTWACVSAFGQVVITPEKAREWLAPVAVEDARPFFVRLFFSIRPTGKMSLAGQVSEPGIKGGTDF
jgi:hypothetical protein